MTHQGKIQKIREKCIETNKEIVELKFGCLIGEVEAFGSSLKGFRYEGGKTFPLLAECRNGDWLFLHDGGVAHIPKSELEKWQNIIGRPITLEDVLRVINEHYTVIEKGIFLDTLSRFWEIKNTDGNNEMKILCRWEPNTPLKDQSPEFIDFIYEIFYGK